MQGFLMNLGMILLFVFWAAVVWFLPVTTATVLMTIYFTKVGLQGYFIMWARPDNLSGLLASFIILIALVLDVVFWKEVRKKYFD